MKAAEKPKGSHGATGSSSIGHGSTSGSSQFDAISGSLGTAFYARSDNAAASVACMQIGSSSHIKLTWKTIAGTGMSLDSWAQLNSELQFTPLTSQFGSPVIRVWTVTSDVTKGTKEKPQNETHTPSYLAGYGPDPDDRAPKLGCQRGLCTRLENNEHADIAAGDQIIDESLVNEALSHTEPSAETLEAETQSTEPIVNSGLHDQLVSVKARLETEIRLHGKPLCYTRGYFFDRPPHPVFALNEAMKSRLDPAKLYQRQVFVWLPHLLPGSPDHFRCTCGQVLSRNGFNDDPIARRVRDIPDDFFLFTNRFICDVRRLNDTECAYISARGAISKSMMRLMRNTFATRLGPAPFSELVSELQHLSHADGELMYTATANFYGQVGLQQYSAFDDRNGYAGSPPSVPYLKALFTDIISAHRIYIERDTASKPCDIGTSDHTFAFLKHMGGLKGEQIFNAAYTLLNNFEELRANSLTQTKSLEEVNDMFEGVQQGLKDSGNPPLQFLYTDSPQAERAFHESIHASLTKNVVPVTNWTDLPPFQTSSGIPTISVADSMEIEAAAHEILQDFSQTPQSQLYLIALAIKAENFPERPPRLDIIQFRTWNKIYVFKGWDGGMGLDVGNGNDDDNFEFDETEFEDASDQIPSMAQPDSAVETIIESVDQTWPILQEAVRSETFHTRILDDAFHFMDRLLRLLSKKHSAFKAFAHDFSEAIFIRDKSDEDAVRAVLEKNGVCWDLH
ncbi:hypothetical protein B0H13DRAFT_2537803 [Mycena leptocephala]|nr:hypothetical protein B0H13DRAFT_2537803 [Mycena leptocephala]